MTLYADRLRADGWEACRTCGGSGDEMQDSMTALGVPGGWVPVGPCPDCVDGVVPPDWMVEAAAKAMLEVNVMPVESHWWLWAARSALVAAARAVKEKK